MKKLLLIILLLALAGCEEIEPAEYQYIQTPVTELSGNSNLLSEQELICVEGKQIWVGWKYYGNYRAGLTSQIVGECDE